MADTKQLVSKAQTTAADAQSAITRAFEERPFAAVAGALAAGIAAGAALPTSDGEAKLMRSLRLSLSGVTAGARAVGMDHLADIGLSSSAIRSAAMALASDVVKSFLTPQKQQPGVLDASSQAS